MHNGLIQKVNTFSQDMALAYISYIHKKLCKLDEGIMLIFCVWKKSAITFIEGCTSHIWYEPLFKILQTPFLNDFFNFQISVKMLPKIQLILMQDWFR